MTADDNTEPNGQHDARVQVLTAEVRTLMVGFRQVTLSVYRQLDWVEPARILPFGRVNTEKRDTDTNVEVLDVVGSASGILARSGTHKSSVYCDGDRRKCGRFTEPAHRSGHSYDSFGDGQALWDEWSKLPLIVLAGLR